MANHYKIDRGNVAIKLKRGLVSSLLVAGVLGAGFCMQPSYQLPKTESFAVMPSVREEFNKPAQEYINKINVTHRIPVGEISAGDVLYTASNTTQQDLREMRRLGF